MSNAEADSPLWSERQGGTLPLTREGFNLLLSHAFEEAVKAGLFREVLDVLPGALGFTSASWDAADAFFTVKLGDPWPSGAIRNRMLLPFQSEDELFTLIELLHRDVVSVHVGDGRFDREKGRAKLRELMAVPLGRRDPSLELSPRGQIVQRGPEPMRRLLEQPLPEGTPEKGVKDRVEDAIEEFRRRDAGPVERRHAVRDLADVLEYLRPDVKDVMLKSDERVLFKFAQDFIRHNDADTRRDFDEPAWLSWAFYVYLATIRLTLHLRDRP